MGACAGLLILAAAYRARGARESVFSFIPNDLAGHNRILHIACASSWSNYCKSRQLRKANACSMRTPNAKETGRQLRPVSGISGTMSTTDISTDQTTGTAPDEPAHPAGGVAPARRAPAPARPHLDRLRLHGADDQRPAACAAASTICPRCGRGRRSQFAPWREGNRPGRVLEGRSALEYSART